MQEQENELLGTLEAQKARIQDLKPSDRKLVSEYLERYMEKNGLSAARQIRTLISLRQFSESFGLAKATERDLETFNIQMSKEKRSLHTVKTNHDILKCFFRFTGNPLAQSKELKSKNPYKNPEYKLKTADLLTPEEVGALIKASNAKPAALIAMLYASGARLGGLRYLKREDCQFDSEGGLTINFISKGQNNSVWIRPDLALIIQKWFNESRFKNPKDFVFPNPNGEPLGAGAIMDDLRRAAHRIKLTKKVYPHLFRHTHASELMNMGLPVSFIKSRLWGSVESRQLEMVYAHLDKKAETDAIKAAFGYATKKETQSDAVKLRHCFACGKTSPFNVAVCECGMSLANPAEIQAKFKERQDHEINRENTLAALQEQMRAVMDFMRENGKAGQ